MASKQDEIMGIIKAYHEKAGGSCGLKLVELLQTVGMSEDEAKSILNELHQAKKFHVRKGINGKLLFYGQKKR